MARGDPMLAYAKQYDALKAELQTLGFLCQGSLQTRRVACGKTTCRCHHDPDARHGPYHYWTRKARGKTVGTHLTEDDGKQPPALTPNSPCPKARGGLTRDQGHGIERHNTRSLRGMRLPAAHAASS